MKKTAGIASGIGLIILSMIGALMDLEGLPPPCWDEGWTLTVARNWVEKGHYGRFLAGEPIPPRLEAAFPVTGLVGASFHFLGVGIWQGRLVGVLCLVGVLGILYILALRLYSHAVAIGTLLVLLLMFPPPSLHPLFMGRQILAEVPALFYLLLGYVFLSLALERSSYWLIGAVAFWGLGLNSKAQVPPFWTVSLLIPLAFVLARRHWKIALRLTLGLLGTFLAYRLFLWGEKIVCQPNSMGRDPLQGMLEVTAMVLAPHSRWFALQTVLEVGLPTLLGLGYALGRWWKQRKDDGVFLEKRIVQLALLALGGSWLAWYLFLSIAWPRYLFPPMMIASLFVSAMLYDLTQGFPLKTLFIKVAALGRNRKSYYRQYGRIGLAGVLILLTVPSTAEFLYRYILNHPYQEPHLRQAADFLNIQVPANALIETYESELHFMLNRRIHYPPDQLHVDLNRRTFLGAEVRIDYNPLAANPDFLVVGSQARMWQLYEPVLQSGGLRIIQRFGPYEIFERVR